MIEQERIEEASHNVRQYVTDGLLKTRDNESKKARNIACNPNVSFTIPLPRRFLTFMPPNCVQFQGTAHIIPFEDEDATAAFNGSLVLRESLKLERRHVQRKAILIRIHPDPVIFAYGLGLSPLGLVRNIVSAISRVEIPLSRLQAQRVCCLNPNQKERYPRVALQSIPHDRHKSTTGRKGRAVAKWA